MTGYLPERVPFYGEFTIKGYLGFVADVKGLQGREKNIHVRRTMEVFGLEGRSLQTLKTLSKVFRRGSALPRHP